MLDVLRGAFEGFGCPKRHPDAMLAKTMVSNDTCQGDLQVTDIMDRLRRVTSGLFLTPFYQYRMFISLINVPSSMQVHCCQSPLTVPPVHLSLRNHCATADCGLSHLSSWATGGCSLTTPVSAQVDR